MEVKSTRELNLASEQRDIYQNVHCSMGYSQYNCTSRYAFLLKAPLFVLLFE